VDNCEINYHIFPRISDHIKAPDFGTNYYWQSTTPLRHW